MHKLYIKQKLFKITDHYEIFDEKRSARFYVDQKFTFFIGFSAYVERADRLRNFVIKRDIWSFMSKYEVDFNNGKSMIIRQNYDYFKKNIDIISQDYCLHLEGNFLDMKFKVYNGENLIAQIDKQFLSFGDTFVIDIIDTCYEDEVVALFIALDEIQDRKKWSRK